MCIDVPALTLAKQQISLAVGAYSTSCVALSLQPMPPAILAQDLPERSGVDFLARIGLNIAR
jgi:hypothetical protein